MEAQNWWDGPVGGLEPDIVGFPFRHIHFAVQVPIFDTVSGTVDVPFRAFTHGNVGILTRVKWQDDQGRAEQTIVLTPHVAIGPDQVYEGVFHIDTTKELDGIRLWRFYAVWTHLNGNVQVARPIYSVNVSNGNPVKNMPDTIRPTGWYKELGALGGLGALDWGYTQVAMDKREFPRGPLTSVWTPTLNCAVNSKGGSPPISRFSIHLDPDFHNGDQGTVLAQRVGAGTLTVSIDPAQLAPGPHRLVGRCEQDADGKHNEGVGVFPFEV
jgi:hypothetical protein